MVKEEPMNDLSVEAALASEPIGGGLPETLEQAEELATSIERAVQRETGRQIRNLTVEVNRNGVRLSGHCTTYYCKQLAQHAAMTVRGGDRLTNSIEVA
jgi:osmotically-inducible protein OsmY